MPIKKHIVKVEKDNKITIPKTLCDALGIGEGTSLKVFSNGNNYSFTCEVPFSYENMKLLEMYREENDKLQARVKELEQTYVTKEVK